MWFLRPLTVIADKLATAYAARETAKTDREKLRIEAEIDQLKARERVLIEEQKHALTRWIRPALAAPVVMLVWKLIVWDTILGWGVTPDPGEKVWWITLTVIGAYFLTRPFEKR